jgi:hypothetical protein
LQFSEQLLPLFADSAVRQCEPPLTFSADLDKSICGVKVRQGKARALSPSQQGNEL